MIAAPLLTAKLICVLVPILAVWTTRSADGFPGFAEIADAFNQWDTQSYIRIAEHGYPATTTVPSTVYLAGFFPGFPILLRLGTLLVGDPLLAGLLISGIAEAIALYFIARLAIAERDAGAARFTVWLFALWPFAFFLSAVYTESTFLAAAAASLYYARQGNLSRASFAAMVACSVRVTGIALIPALAWELYRRDGVRPSRDWVALALVPTPILAFCLYMHVHAGNFFAYLVAQSSPSFNHHLAPPWVGFWRTFGQVQGNPSYTFTFEVIFGVLGAVMCVALWLHPRFPTSLALYCTAVYVIATSLNIWLSVARYELAMFPALIVLSDLTRRRLELRAAIVSTSGALMACGAALFTSGRWLG